MQQHLNTAGTDQCVFYTDGALDEANSWAEANGKQTIFSLDRDGWTEKKIPITYDHQQMNDYAADCPMSLQSRQQVEGTANAWTDGKSQEYWINMSKAFALGCSGTSYIILKYTGPVYLPPSSNGMFAMYEFPLLQREGGGVNTVILLRTNGGVIMQQMEYWRRCQA
jgi:hypothetical protein